MKQVKKWSVVLVSFSDATGTEVQKSRPCIVVSSNSIHRHLKRATVIPLTSSLNDDYPFRVEIKLQVQTTLAMLDQITTVDFSRIIRHLESLPVQHQTEILEALQDYFAAP